MSKKHYQGSEEFIKGSKVEVRNKDFSKAFRQFKKKIQEDGIFQELRERQFYEKPSVKRKRKKAAARSRWLKKIAKEKNE